MARFARTSFKPPQYQFRSDGPEMMRKIASMRKMMRKIAVMHKMMRKTMRTIIFMRKMVRKIAFMRKMMRKMKISSSEGGYSR